MKSSVFYSKYFTNGRSRHLELGIAPSDSLRIIVVIPSHNETDLINAISSLTTYMAPSEVEILIIENYSKDAAIAIKDQAQKNHNDVALWKAENTAWSRNVFHCICSLEPKHAGVGLGRKIGMDTAARRFNLLENPEGLILNYDADCTCDSSLIKEVLDYFADHQSIKAASLYFEHPFQELMPSPHRKAIVDYELHLRIFIQWQRYLNLPYAYHTVGSSMAVRAGAYTRKGGMNKRKAGEDFYFIHKFTDEHYGEINSTCVIPSCRSSDRVPFGTGRAILLSLGNTHEIDSYNPASFELLKMWLDQLILLYQGEELDVKLDDRVFAFLKLYKWSDKLIELKKNTTDYKSFAKRFYQWFDAFRLMKYLHYMRDHGFPNVSCIKSMQLWETKREMDLSQSNEKALLKIRKVQRDCLY